MKTVTLLLALVLMAGGLQAQKKKKKKKKGEEEIVVPVVPQNELDSFSYSYGIMLHNQFKSIKLEINPDMVINGFKHMSGDSAVLGDEESQKLVNDVFQAAQQRNRPASQQGGVQNSEAQAKAKAVAAENLAKGQAFLTANATADGVQTTASGLQYKVVKEGTGAKPKATDQVKVHYKGTLIDGTKFDSSYDRGTPAEFPLNRVIRGWTEGLQLMSEGSTYMFYIPFELAYGPNGRPPTIGPNSVLIFQVELLNIVPTP